MKHRTTIRLFSFFAVLSMLVSAVGLPTQAVLAENAGTALQFTGTSQYVTFGQAAGTDTGLGVQVFTIELWFKKTGTGTPTSTGTNGLSAAIPLVTKGRGESENSNVDMNYFFGIDSATNRLAADFEECSTANSPAGCPSGGTAGLNHPAFGSTALQNNVWYHAAVTYDGRYWKFYLNGVQDGLLTDVGAIRYPRWDSIQYAGIGTAMTSTGAAAGYFTGITDEVRIWNVVRTQNEIQADMSNELTSGTGLIGRWGLNEGTGLTATNSVSGRPNGALISTPTWVSGFPLPDTTPPAAPTNLSATAGNTFTSLSWAANTEPDIAGYNLYRSNTSGGSYIRVNGALITATSYQDIGLLNGTSYYYVLRAVDTANNESINSNEATATPIFSNTALQFTSPSGTYVTFGDPSKLDLSTYTIETWFKRTGSGTPNTTGTGGIDSAIPLVTHGSPEGDGSSIDANWILAIDDTNDVIAADFEDMATGANHPVYGVTQISENVWHHAAATYDGTTWKLYLDGNLETTLVVGSFTPRSDTTQRAGLGTMIRSGGAANGYFQGVIDEARVWNVARTQAQINADINNQPTSGTGLVARWGLDDGIGTAVSDTISPAANGSVTGTNYSWVTGAPFNILIDNIPPAVPTGLTTSAGSALVNLAWSANTEPDLAGYNLYRSTTMGGSYARLNNSLITTTTYTDTGLAIGTPYYYVLTAVDTYANESAYSMEASATPTAPLEPANGLDLGSGSAYVTFGDPAKLDLATFTIETWFKRTGAGTPNTTGTNGIGAAIPLVTHGAPEADGSNVDANWILAIDNATGKIAADFEDMATGLNHPVYGMTVIANNVWHHAAATYDGTTWRLYLDGNLEATLPVNQTPRSDSIQKAALGTMLTSATPESPLGHFQGVLDETRIWSVARSQAEIQSDINNQLTNATGLVARWGFGETTGTLVRDSISNPADGTITGSGTSRVSGAPFNIIITPPTQYTLNVTTSGSGSVMLSPAGGLYQQGTVVTLTAVPNNGWVFSSWAGDLTGSSITTTLTMDTNKSVTATFIESYEATASFQQDVGGYAGTVDSLLYEAIPGTSYGTLDYVKWDTTGTVGSGTGQIFGLLRFENIFGSETGQIPPGSTIQSAQLQYVVFDAGDPANVNEVSVDWDETTTYAGFGGESGVQADEYGASVGTATGSPTGTYALDVTASLRTWSDNQAGNRGWIFRPTNSGGVQFRSKESATVAEHPRLVVTYLTNVPPNQAPSQPVLVAPASGGTDISTSPTLTVHVSDPNVDALNVSFYGRVAGGPAPAPFTFVTIPDTQNYSLSDTAATYFNGQTQWIVNQRTDRNIVFASHMGDITEHGDTAAEWARADAAMDILDNAGLPNGVVPGNHDMGTLDFGTYASTFPPSRYQGFSWYGGYLGDPNDGITDFGVDRGNRDSYQLFSTAGMDFIVIHLELDPPQYAIDWANAVLDAYPQRRAIVVTHAFVNTSGSRPTAPYTRTTDGKSAEYVWQNLIYPNCQVFLVLNGNYPGEGRRSDPNSCGQSVHQVLQDYQNYSNGGNGYLRYYVFDPAQDQIQAYTYSPVLNQYETDASSQFTLAYDMPAGAAFTLIGTQSVASGSDASIAWNNRTAGTQYEWYAVASDGSKSTKSATWNFTTGTPNNIPQANDQSVSTSEDASHEITLTASDADQDPLTYSVVTGPAHGTLTGTAPALTYTPNPNYNGSDSFTFKVNDGKADSNVAAVSITVTPVNDAPVCPPYSTSTNEDTAVELTLVCSDVDNDPLTYSIVTGPSSGSAVLSGNKLTYTPNANFSGQDDLSFKANDGTVDSPVSTVTLTITPVNDAPVCQALTITTSEDLPGETTVNCSDVDNTSLTYEITPAANGVASLAGSTISYAPHLNFFGNDAFTYRAFDGELYGVPAPVAVTVYAVNDPPVAVDDAVSIDEDTPVQVPVLVNDSDVDGDTLHVVSTGKAAHGAVVLNGDQVQYTPDASYNGTDVFTYTISDGNGGTATASVHVTVTAQNDVPVAANDTYTTQEDGTLVVPASSGILGNDVDTDGDTLTAVLVQGVAHGTLALDPDGSFTYAPTANFNGTDTFTYRAKDGSADSNIATVTITVTPLNDAPVAAGQSPTVSEDSALPILLAASDVDGDPLVFSIVSGPSHGVLAGTLPSLTYTPDLNFNGADSFVFAASDGFLSGQAQVQITIDPVNDAPVAVVDSYPTDQGNALVIPALGVLKNDTDVEGDALTAVLGTNVAHGSLTLNADGSFAYTPIAGFTGVDTFTYLANDGTANSNEVTVTISVNTVNHAPVAVDDSYSTNEDTPLVVAAEAGVLGNDSDADGNPLTVAKDQGPSHGTLTLNADGSFTYAPDANWYGPDSFSYRASDGQLESSKATVTITVASVNDVPVASPQAVSVLEDGSVSITLTGSDADGDALTYAVTSGPLHGTWSGTLPAMLYTPAPNYAGEDSFTFTVNDGQADSAPATVSILVNAVNDLPVCQALDLSTAEDTPLTAAPVCSDVDSVSLSYTIVSPAGHGTASVSASLLAYSPALNYYGADGFTYKANDGQADSNAASVTVTISAVNDAPALTQPASQANAEGSTVSLQLSASDAEGDPIAYSAIGLPAGLTLNAATGLISGTLEYASAATYSVTVTATDNHGAAESKSFTWLVSDVKYTLTTVVIGSGSVLKSPDQASYEPGTLVQLTAQPAAGWTFSGWSGDATGTSTTATVTMNGNKTVTATFVQNTLIFQNSFGTTGSCGPTGWSSVVNPGALSFNSAAAFDTGCGMQVNITNTSSAYERDDNPLADTHYRAAFQFNPHGLTMGKNDSHAIFSAYNSSNASIVVVEMRRNGSSYQVRAGTTTDKNKWMYTSWVTLANNWQLIDVDWRAATSAGANNGTLSLTVGTGAAVSVTGLDNDTRKVEWIALGAVSGLDSTTKGTYYFDAFESRR